LHDFKRTRRERTRRERMKYPYWEEEFLESSVSAISEKIQAAGAEKGVAVDIAVLIRFNYHFPHHLSWPQTHEPEFPPQDTLKFVEGDDGPWCFSQGEKKWMVRHPTVPRFRCHTPRKMFAKTLDGRC